MLALAEIAAAEFTRRRDKAVARVAAGNLAANDANALLMPWLAMACRAGATIDELERPLAEAAATSHFTPDQIRACLADDICPLPQVRDALADARDAAIDRAELRGDEALDDRARGLIRLALRFDCRPYAQRVLEPAS